MKTTQMVKLGLGAARICLKGERIPLNVMLSVTNHCNARCSYCDIPARVQNELTDDEIHKLIDEMADAGTRRIGIWGGEPLLRDAIGDFVDHARERGIYTTLDTNGYLFEKRQKALQNLDHILFSLDGEAAYHDKNREDDSFRKTMKAIEQATSAGMNVWTITVLTRHNLGSIDFILSEAERLGYKATFQVLHHNDEMSKTGMTMRPDDDEQYRQAIRQLIDAKTAGRPVGSSFNYLNHILSWEDFSVPKSPTPHRGLNCLAGHAFCNVDTDGTVYPCSLLIGDFKGALNIRDVGFKRAFDATWDVPCKSCAAACFTEYSYLFDLHVRTVAEWSVAMFDTGEHHNSLVGKIGKKLLPVFAHQAAG